MSGSCEFCGQLIFHEEFKDDASLQEYLMYGRCQDCQNNTSD